MGKIHVGFSGTQEGMTSSQERAVGVYLCGMQDLWGVYAHHGNCIGADEQFHALCEMMDIYVIIHPCNIVAKQAGCVGQEVRPVLPPLERNRQIVAESAIMIATPKSPLEQTRSGTWATVRYARKAKMPLLIVQRNGTTYTERI